MEKILQVLHKVSNTVVKEYIHILRRNAAEVGFVCIQCNYWNFVMWTWTNQITTYCEDAEKSQTWTFNGGSLFPTSSMLTPCFQYIYFIITVRILFPVSTGLIFFQHHCYSHLYFAILLFFHTVWFYGHSRIIIYMTKLGITSTLIFFIHSFFSLSLPFF